MSSGSSRRSRSPEFKEVEGDQVTASVILPGMQEMKISDAAIAFHNTFSVDQKASAKEPSCSGGDGRIPARPIISAAGDSEHTITLPSHHEAVAVVLEFMKPVRPCGD